MNLNKPFSHVWLQVSTLTIQLSAEVQSHASMSSRCAQLEKRIADDKAAAEARVTNLRSQYNKVCEDRIKAEESERLVGECSSRKDIDIDRLSQGTKT